MIQTNTTVEKGATHRLATKLATILEELSAAWLPGVEPTFSQLRSTLGRHRVLVLPSVKNYNEVILDQGERMRITVVLEVTLLDADSDDSIQTRWVGQAVDSPDRCYEQAVAHALEDFLRKTFLFLPASSTLGSAPAPQPIQAHPEEPQIRRRPQGAAASSDEATPHSAPEKATPAQTTLMAPTPKPEPKTQQMALGLEPATPTPDPKPKNTPKPAANDDDSSAPMQPPVEDEGLGRSMLLADSKPWKAANALWRALVSEVCSAEVMEAYEGALEVKAQVDSWRKIPAEQLREWCHMLRRRSSMPSDMRKISDREEYILSHLEEIPEGSSLDRLDAELRRLCAQAVDQAQTEAFMALYLRRMDAARLSEVSGRSAVALCRKLRRLHEPERRTFIQEALDSAAQEDAA